MDKVQEVLLCSSGKDDFDRMKYREHVNVLLKEFFQLVASIGFLFGTFEDAQGNVQIEAYTHTSATNIDVAERAGEDLIFAVRKLLVQLLGTRVTIESDKQTGTGTEGHGADETDNSGSAEDLD